MKVSTSTNMSEFLRASSFRVKRMCCSRYFFILLMFGSLITQAQTSVQNFGGSTFSQTSATGSTAVIPNPTSGTTWARGGAVAPAAPINGLNTSNPLGTTGTYVRATASATTSVAKFSPWVAYSGSTEFYTSFKVLFGDISGGNTATSGVWKFYQGTGAMYSDANDFSGAQVFTGLTFTYGAGGALALTYRLGAANSTSGLTQTAFSSATVYNIEIVGNNKTTGTINYNYNGSAQSVAVQKFDLYVNGTLIGDDLGEAALPANTSIVSGTFIGISSTSNVANIFVDDAIVYNAVPANIGNAAPTVTTNASPSAIGTTTATLNGNVTSDGGSTITARGIVYSQTSLNPTPSIGGASVTNFAVAGTTGAFSAPASALPVNTQISYRAYATNAIGTSYGGGSGTTFYTLANTPVAPVINGATANSLNVAIGSGDGNPSTTQYAIQETGSNNYVQADGSLSAAAVWQTAAAWGTKTVTGLAPLTMYTFQVKARNTAGTETAFGSTASGTTLSAASPVLNATVVADFGSVCTGTTTGAHTFTITGSNLTAANVTVAALNGFSYSTDDVSYTPSLSIMQPGGSFSQLIYVKFNPALVQSYNGNVVVSGGGSSDINVPVTGSGINTAPSVTTGTATSVTQLSATLNGTITAAGCTGVTAYGVEYSTLNGFVNGTGTPSSSGNLSMGAFSSAISGLTANTMYYFHAYATNGAGTSYGSQQGFLTPGLDAPVALAATNNTTGTSFTANWNAVNGANSYRLDVSTSPTFSTTNATDLFISEYVEGTSNNKYIEIYNGTGAVVNLTDYKLQLYTNGSPTVSQDITLSGTLANGATMVYKNSGAVAYAGAATANAAVNYNGDDAVALFKISTNSYVDIFGSIGFDPGTAWTGAGGYSTMDKTLVRNANVAGGLTMNPATNFPTLTTEWTLFNVDDVSHLGTHTFSAVSPSFVPGYNNLTVNGLSQSVTGLMPNTTYYYRVRAFSPTSTSSNSNTITVVTPCVATVAASAGANGTVTPVGTTSYNCGDDALFNITPNACYTIANVIVDGVSQGPVNTYTFTNISAGTHTISASFVRATFIISATYSGSGSVTPPGDTAVNCGDNITYSITPDACHSIAAVFVDAVSVGAVNTYTFNNVTDIHTISVAFVPTPYTITVTSGIGGTILPGSGTVNCGSNANYTITPNACYSIADVLVDGVSVGAVSSFLFTNVMSDHTISATFTLTTYTITASSGANGTVSPVGTTVVGCGTSDTYSISPAACYHINDVLVDGASQGPVTTYTFSNIMANHTISASFTADPALTAPVVTGPVNVCPFINTGDQVVYTASATGATGYTWVIPPTNVTIISGQGTSHLTVTFQTGFAAQNNKQLRVIATSACGNSPITVYYLLTQSPSTPQPITGNTNVCPIIGTPATYTYTIAAIPGASEYAWSAQAGTTTIGHPNGTGVNDTTVTVSFSSSFTSSAITVAAVNGCGTSPLRSLTLIKVSPSTPGPITGPGNVCANIAPGGTPAVYSVNPVAGVTYNWTIPTGAIAVSGQGTASISFTYPAGYTGGTISVSASNGCGTSGTRTLTVTRLLPSTPSPIDVIQSQGCPDRIFTYSLIGIPANAVSVQWTSPAGSNIASGQGTASITVSYPTDAINGFVTATAVNNCGTSAARSVAAKYASCGDAPPPPPGPRPAAKGIITAATAVPEKTMQVNVFPNPSVSDFKLQVLTDEKQIIQVRILDMAGREFKNIIVPPLQLTSIGSGLGAGSYLMEVKQGNTVKTMKLIKF